jgi:hypothetical protein
MLIVLDLFFFFPRRKDKKKSKAQPDGTHEHF